MAAISYEAALDACRRKLGELTYEMVLKDARIADLEAQLAAVDQAATQSPASHPPVAPHSPEAPYEMPQTVS